MILMANIMKVMLKSFVENKCIILCFNFIGYVDLVLETCFHLRETQTSYKQAMTAQRRRVPKPVASRHVYRPDKMTLVAGYQRRFNVETCISKSVNVRTLISSF